MGIADMRWLRSPLSHCNFAQLCTARCSTQELCGLRGLGSTFVGPTRFLARQSRHHAAYDKDFYAHPVGVFTAAAALGFFDGYFKGGFFLDGAFDDFNGFFDSLPLRSLCWSRL